MADTTAQTTVIGTGTHIKGDMTFEGSARLLGSFEGKITAKGDLQVADGAACKATVEAGTITIDGTVEGNVTARERIELTSRAKMKGDLVAAKLLVAEGASFIGHVTVGPDAAKNAGHTHAQGGQGVGSHQNAAYAEPKSGLHVQRVETAIRR
jgi:cytoskeletal protein CcmA (bactofilin family)